MTPAARLQAVIEILGGGTGRPLAHQLKAWFRGHRFAGSKDRHAITERVYAIFRQRAHFAQRMASEDPRALAIASLLAGGEDPHAFFTGGYGPEPLTAAEEAAVAREPQPAPQWVVHEYPPWLEDELTRAFGNRLKEEMEAFRSRAPVDLRVNRLTAGRQEVLAAFARDGFGCEILPDLPDAIRCPPGANLKDHPLYGSGAFEIQDWAAQRSVVLSDVRPGMRVLDLAAGAGGKSLALSAAMENRGEVVACDIRKSALAELERRAARAGVSIIWTHLLGEPPPGPFDLVFLDAPCSGSGTWRRQPELKWRLTPERLAALTSLQDRLLDQAAAGRRIAYATCSIFPRENQDRVEGFLARHPDFARARPDFHASPARTGSDGFYMALLAQG